MTTMLDDPGLPDTVEVTSGISARSELAFCLEQHRQLGQDVNNYVAFCREAEAEEAEALANP